MSLAEFSRTALELMSLVDSALQPNAGPDKRTNRTHDPIKSMTAEMKLEIKALKTFEEQKAKAIADASSKPGKARSHVAEEEDEEQRAEKKRPRKAQKEVVNMKRIRPKREVNKVAAAPIPIPIQTADSICKGALAEKRDNGQLYVAWVQLELEGKPSSAFGGNVYKALQDMNFRKVVGNGWDYDKTEHRQYVFYSVRQALVLAKATQVKKKANGKEKTKKNK